MSAYGLDAFRFVFSIFVIAAVACRWAAIGAKAGSRLPATLLDRWAGGEHQRRRDRRAMSRLLLTPVEASSPIRILRAVVGELLDQLQAEEAIIVLREAATGRTFRWQARHNGREQRTVLRYSELRPSEQAAYFVDMVPAVVWCARRVAHSAGISRIASLDPEREWLARCDHVLPAQFGRAHAWQAVLSVAAEPMTDWAYRVFVIHRHSARDWAQSLGYVHRFALESAAVIREAYIVTTRRASASPREWAYVAQELHDGPIQRLIVAEMQLRRLRQQLSTKQNGTARELSRLQRALHREILELRELMQRVKPIAVAPGTLVEYIRETAAQFELDTAIPVCMISDLTSVDLSSRACARVARIVKEAFWNVNKHSGASTVLVLLAADDRQYSLTIEDNGRGWQLNGRAAPRLIVIEECVRALGGAITFGSSFAGGARLEITFRSDTNVRHASRYPAGPNGVSGAAYSSELSA